SPASPITIESIVAPPFVLTSVSPLELATILPAKLLIFTPLPVCLLSSAKESKRHVDVLSLKSLLKLTLMVPPLKLTLSSPSTSSVGENVQTDLPVPAKPIRVSICTGDLPFWLSNHFCVEGDATSSDWLYASM